MPDARGGEVMLRVLVVDHDPNTVAVLSNCLQADGHSVLLRPALGQATEDIARQVFDLMFVDASSVLARGDRFLEGLLKDYPWTKIVVLAEQGSAGLALDAIRLGASDY